MNLSKPTAGKSCPLQNKNVDANILLGSAIPDTRSEGEKERDREGQKANARECAISKEAGCGFVTETA